MRLCVVQSFRFGPNIAFLASVMRSERKSVYQQTLTGGLQDGERKTKRDRGGERERERERETHTQGGGERERERERSSRRG